MFIIVLGCGCSAPSIRLYDRSGCSAILAMRPIRILGKLILELLMLLVVEIGMWLLLARGSNDPYLNRCLLFTLYLIVSSF